MSKINDGGPAFPPAVTVSGAGDIYLGFDGMSLRDWFSGQALAGICANGHTPWSPDVADIADSEIAKAAYELADAMLAAREAGQP